MGREVRRGRSLESTGDSTEGEGLLQQVFCCIDRDETGALVLQETGSDEGFPLAYLFTWPAQLA